MSATEKNTSFESVGKPDNGSALAAHDVFGDEKDHEIQYKTLSWQVSPIGRAESQSAYVLSTLQFMACMMIAEIVSTGLLSLPNAMAVVGIVPALILTIFLGVFGLFTAKLLIDFKLNHPEVHNMGQSPVVRSINVRCRNISHSQETRATSCSVLSAARFCHWDLSYLQFLQQ